MSMILFRSPDSTESFDTNNGKAGICKGEYTLIQKQDFRVERPEGKIGGII
jgi:hypothetical protein